MLQLLGGVLVIGGMLGLGMSYLEKEKQRIATLEKWEYITELYVNEMHIAEYRFGSYLNHPAKRERKLLLNKRELLKLAAKSKERGFTIIPVMLYINPSGLAKLTISLAKGKKFFDKRESLKEKDSRREMDRVQRMKNNRFDY